VVRLTRYNKAPQSRGFPFYSRINESLFALALVDPTQYTTQLDSRPYFLRHSHHNCHLRSLAELSISRRMAAGAVSGSQHTGSGSPGGTSRSALGAINAVGCVDELEQPAISNALSGIRIFDAITINHLFLDYFDSADLRFLLLLFC